MLFQLIVGSSVLVGYLALVRYLRYRRIDGLQKKYGSNLKQFKDLNYREAQEILGQMGLFEFPWVFLAGKDFAFLRVSLPTVKRTSQHIGSV